VVALVAVLALLGWFGGWRVYGWYHRSAGAGLLERDHSQEALPHLQAALRVWPDDPNLLLLTARAARRAGILNLAQACLDRCRSAAAVEATVELEHVLLRATRGEGDAVAAYCDALAQQDELAAPLIYEAMAEGYLASLRYPEASFYVEKWIERVPESAQALFTKGRIETQLLSLHAAAELFEQAVQIDPDHDDARWQLALLQLEFGNAPEAYDHLILLRRRMPDNVMLRVRLARCLDLLGKQEEATALLDEVLARQPTLFPALVERGRLAVRSQDYEHAQEWLADAVRRNPGNHDAQYQYMLCMRGLGKKVEAEAAHERMLQIEKDAKRLRTLASSELSLRPRDAALHAEIGTIYMRLGALEQGVHWLESAVQLDPRQTEAQRALAAHYQALGQFGRAERHRLLAAGASAKANP
jgi:tetratricopeptide (TPR) repeat protein